MITIQVLGVPAPQGSKVLGKYGNIRETNPNTKPWRQAVSWEAAAAMIGKQPLLGPLKLSVTFIFPRPKSHYRTGKHAAELKESAPSYCDKKPDADKLLRAIGDSCSSIVFRDDAQLVVIDAEKRYGDAPGAYIEITELDAPLR